MCNRAVDRPASAAASSAASSIACWSASCAVSLSRRSQRTSGWRRTMPEAVHGASSRMASKGWPSHHSAGRPASATTTLRLEAEPGQGLADAAAALGVDLQGGHLDRHVASVFEQMRRLAAGGGAGVEHPQRRTGSRRGEAVEQQGAASWAAASCTEHIAVGEARELLHRPRLRAAAAPSAPTGMAVEPDALQARAGSAATRALAAVDPQRHGRLLVVGGQHALPFARVVAPQALDPPARMVPLRDRLVLGGRHQLVALAQEAAQAGVDEAGLRPRDRVALGGLHRLVDQREGLVGRATRPSQASASAVHSRASAGGGGVRLARWRRSASARPSQRSTWKPSACTPGRSAGSMASKATRARGAGADRRQRLRRSAATGARAAARGAGGSEEV